MILLTIFGSPKALRRATQSGPVALLAALLAFACGWGGDPCAAQILPATQSDAGTLLRPSQSQEFELLPNQHKVFWLDPEAKTSAQLSVEQTREMLSVSWSSGAESAHVPRTNDAGLHSLIRFSILPSEPGHYVFDVSCLHAHLPCAGIVSVSAARLASDLDASVALEEEALADAEDIRRHGDRSRWPLALADFRHAADFFQSNGDAIFRRAALNGEARLLLYKLNDYQAAREIALASAAVDTGQSDRQGEGLAWKTLSSAQYFLGDYAASIAAAQKAIAFYEQTGDDYWQGILLGNLAYTYRETGDTDHALEASEQALAIARRIQDEFGVAFNLETLATVHLSRGELEQSFDLYYQALDATHVQPYPAVQGAIWSGLGDLYSQLNDQKRAEECFQKALPLTDSASDTAGMLKVISSLGDLYLNQGRPKDALVTLQQGLKQAEKLGLVREQSILATSIARGEAELGDGAAARAQFHSAVSIAGRIANKNAEASARLQFGDFEYRSGDSVAARDLYARAYDLWSQESNRAKAATALASLARLDSDAGALSKAQKEIEDALDFFETSRATLPSRELRTSFFSSKHAYYDLAVSILMRLHEKDRAQGYDVRAFAISERASSRALLDEVASGNVPTFMHAPAALLREQKSNRSHLDALFERLRTLSDEPQKNSDALAKLRTEIEDQLRASDTLEGRIRAASAAYATWTGARPASASEIREGLEAGSALAKYWVGADATYLWLTTHEGFRSFTIQATGDRIRLLASRWLEALQARSQQKPGESLAERGRRLSIADGVERRTAESLGKLLLSPLGGRTGLESIYIVPDGALSSIPFAALRMPVAGAPGEAHSSQILLSRFTVLTEPSESILQLLSQSHPAVDRAPRIAVFADAVYSVSDPRVERGHLRSSAPATTPETLRWATEAAIAQLPRLRATREEARMIGALNGAANTTIHLGFQTLSGAVRDGNWSQYEIVHFGTHALLNTERPAFSGVVFTMVEPNGAPQNGILWLSDIYALHMPVNLVVLSGCHTANGREIPGEGLEGLSRAFFFAGARSVVGSLWSVEDRETSLLMQRFYRNLIREKLSPATALRRAQLATAARPSTAPPYYWAGFTVQGNGATPLRGSP